MAEFDWETALRKSIRDDLAYLCEIGIRPTSVEERREFGKFVSLGYIVLSCDSRNESIPWFHFPKRLLADLIRLEAKYASLWARFEEQDGVQTKLERELATLKAKKSRKAQDA